MPARFVVSVVDPQQTDGTSRKAVVDPSQPQLLVENIRRRFNFAPDAKVMFFYEDGEAFDPCKAADMEVLQTQASQSNAEEMCYLSINVALRDEVSVSTTFPSELGHGHSSQSEIRLKAQKKAQHLIDKAALPEEEEEEEIGLSECLPGFPADSKLSNLLENITLVIILISVAVFCLETLPQYRLNDNGEERESEAPAFFWTETACIIWFTIEYILRFSASQDKGRFPFRPLNLVDLIAILPYYISLGVGSSGASSLAVIRILRLSRVTRLLKFSRHSQGLQDLIACMAATRTQLVLFFGITMVSTILFASAMFFAEGSDSDDECQATFCYTSIPAAQWWAIVTMTTVGYGDMFPDSPLGKVIGALTATLGVVLLAIPAGIFISEFMRLHEERKKLASADVLKAQPEDLLNELLDMADHVKRDIVQLQNEYSEATGVAFKRKSARFSNLLQPGMVAPGYYKGKIGIRF